MNHRERVLAVLNYQSYDHLPLVHFGFWTETLEKWAEEGHISMAEALGWGDGNEIDRKLGAQLGFDFNWSMSSFGPYTHLQPQFERKTVAEFPDGTRHVLNGDGVVVVQKDDATGIPAEIDHLLKGRAEWEEHYLPRLKFTPQRVNANPERIAAIQSGEWTYPVQIWCGSLYGYIRDWLGVVNASYLQVDDPDLFTEMIDTLADLTFQSVEANLAQIPADVPLDYGHFWEDICFKSGPLIKPALFRQKIGPHYRRITDLLHRRGVNLVSLDCDGKIDALLPIWLENGVNVMYPIEVGTWNASIKPWREKYGRELRGVGGMDKRVFAFDRPAIDAEVERLKELVDLGGYIPCPDHRIPPDAKWENVLYYTERMRRTFGG